MADPKTTDIIDLTELATVARLIPPDRLDWLITQGRLLLAGKPNCIDGTTPKPAWLLKAEGAGNAACPA